MFSFGGSLPSLVSFSISNLSLSLSSGAIVVADPAAKNVRAVDKTSSKASACTTGVKKDLGCTKAKTVAKKKLDKKSGTDIVKTPCVALSCTRAVCWS